MSSLRDKRLLLPGIVDTHSLHGYALDELPNSPAYPFRVAEAGVYQILAWLAKQEFISGREERQPGRPPRTVYALAAAGKADFVRLLKKRLSGYQPLDYPDSSTLRFVEMLPPDSAVLLLDQRSLRLADRCATFSGFSDDIRASHPGLDPRVRLCELESNMLQTLIEKLKRRCNNDDQGAKSGHV